MTRTPFSRSKGQKVEVTGRFTHSGVNASGCSCSGEHGNVLAVETYNHIAVCMHSAGAVGLRREALRRQQREERGGGILWRLPHSLFLYRKKVKYMHNYNTLLHVTYYAPPVG